MNIVRENVQAIEIKDVMSVYSGRAGKCACGCAGKHSYAKTHRAIAGEDRGYAIGDDEINDRQVKRVLRLVQAHDGRAEISRASGFVAHVAVTVAERVYVVYLLPGVDVAVEASS